MYSGCVNAFIITVYVYINVCPSTMYVHAVYNHKHDICMHRRVDRAVCSIGIWLAKLRKCVLHSPCPCLQQPLTHEINQSVTRSVVDRTDNQPVSESIDQPINQHHVQPQTRQPVMQSIDQSTKQLITRPTKYSKQSHATNLVISRAISQCSSHNMYTQVITTRFESFMASLWMHAEQNI